MTTTKRKKVTKYRGSKTHGCGSMKKRRGAGNRGGRGLAGSGKRAMHHKQRIVKLFGKGYLGGRDFKVPYKKIKIVGVNLKYLEEHLNDIIEMGLGKKEGDSISIDLSKLGFNKLLGSGNVNSKFKIKTKFFSKKAKEKLEKKGGEIVSS